MVFVKFKKADFYFKSDETSVFLFQKIDKLKKD